VTNLGHDLSLVRELAEASQHLAVLAIARGDGSVHASLVSAGVLSDPWTGADAVGVVVRGGARKLSLLRTTGRATLIFKDGFRWVAVEGAARLEGPNDPPPTARQGHLAETLRDIFRAAGGMHEDWDEYDRVMAQEQRCAVFVQVESVTTN